jgi:hypothetical protein
MDLLDVRPLLYSEPPVVVNTAETDTNAVRTVTLDTPGQSCDRVAECVRSCLQIINIT